MNRFVIPKGRLVYPLDALCNPIVFIPTADNWYFLDTDIVSITNDPMILRIPKGGSARLGPSYLVKLDALTVVEGVSCEAFRVEQTNVSYSNVLR